MSLSYLKVEEFKAAHEQFEQIIESLLSEPMNGYEHGEVERYLHCEGNELLRRLLQGHLEVRSAREIEQISVIDASGQAHTHRRRGCRRPLMSEFGEVEIKRIGYSGQGLGSLYPLDRELNLPPDKYSHGLRRRAVEEAIKSSFDQGVESLERTTGGKVPKSQFRELMPKISQDFGDYYQHQESQPGKANELLVLSGDGKGIVMRQEDLRPATRQAAAKQANKSGARLKSGEKRQRKRMAQVAAIYDIEPHCRAPAQIIDCSASSSPDETMAPQPKPPRPKPSNKRVWASVEKSIEPVMEQLFEEALNRDPEQKRPWVMLIDGHEDQLRVIERLMEKNEVVLTIILDLIHVMEYIWKAAYCFFDSQTQHEQAQQWVEQRLRMLLEGKVSDVAAGMRRSATRQNLTQAQRQAVDKCADYLLKYKAFVQYDHYLAEGYPIGTGVIEGACRHLINDRMNITGARWRLACSEALLKLRSLKSSGDLEDYFKFHQAQERQRNHVSKFESGEKMAA